MDATGTSRAKKPTFYARKEDLPPEMREKFEAWQNRGSQRHPLYERESLRYGNVPRGVEVTYQPPEFRKAGNLCVLGRAREARGVVCISAPPARARKADTRAQRPAPRRRSASPPPRPPPPRSSKHFLKVSGDRRTTLDTSITKKSFRD
jgi:hypothetical protein